MGTSVSNENIEPDDRGKTSLADAAIRRVEAEPGPGMVSVALDELEKVTLGALSKLGYDPSESRIIADSIIWAETSGNSQGVIKLLGADMKREPYQGTVWIAEDTPSYAKLGSNYTHGMVVLHKAVWLAAEKAADRGIAWVGTSGSTSSTGALGYFTEQLAKKGFVGIIISATPALVAPYGAAQKLLGTNPISIGIPSDGSPFVLDITTAATTYYDVLRVKNAGGVLRDGVAIDKSGKPTTDPDEAIAGAILPLDQGPRGSGLAMAIELLAGAFVGAQSNSPGQKKDSWGNLVIALKPDSEFARKVSEFLVGLKLLQKIDGVDEILYPGEIGQRSRQKAFVTGVVEINDSVWSKVKELAI